MLTWLEGCCVQKCASWRYDVPQKLCFWLRSPTLRFIVVENRLIMQDELIQE